MPYITQRRRKELACSGCAPINAGELTYELTRECHRYIAREQGGESFQTYAEVLGALEATKLELYRRHVAPYEDVKRIQNGDV